MAELTWAEMSVNLDRQKELIKAVLPVAPDEQSRQQVKDRIEKSAIKLFRAFILTTNREDVIRQAVVELEQKIADSSTADKDVLKMVEEMQKLADDAEEKYLAGLTDNVVMENGQFVQYREELNEIYEEIAHLTPSRPSSSAADDDDEDPESLRSYIPTVDPVTKRPLTDPMRNMHCNHFYGKDSIKKLIATNPRARCPYGGCPNKQFLRLDHLVFDGEMAAKIASKIADQEKKNEQRKKTPVRNKKTLVNLDD